MASDYPSSVAGCYIGEVFKRAAGLRARLSLTFGHDFPEMPVLQPVSTHGHFEKEQNLLKNQDKG